MLLFAPINSFLMTILFIIIIWFSLSLCKNSLPATFLPSAFPHACAHHFYPETWFSYSLHLQACLSSCSSMLQGVLDSFQKLGATQSYFSYILQILHFLFPFFSLYALRVTSFCSDVVSHRPFVFGRGGGSLLICVLCHCHAHIYMIFLLYQFVNHILLNLYMIIVQIISHYILQEYYNWWTSHHLFHPIFLFPLLGV